MTISVETYRGIRLCALATVKGMRYSGTDEGRQERRNIIEGLAWARANLHRPAPCLHRVYRARVECVNGNFAADSDDPGAPEEITIGVGGLMFIDMCVDPGVYSMADIGLTGCAIFVDDEELRRDFDPTPWRVKCVNKRWHVVDEIADAYFPLCGCETLADALRALVVADNRQGSN